MAKTVVIPTNPADQKVILDAMKEMSDCFLRIDSEKDQIKAIVETIVEKFELPKSMVNRMGRVYHKNNFDKVSVEHEDFAELYETIVG